MKRCRCHTWLLACSIAVAAAMAASLHAKPDGKKKKAPAPNYYPLEVGNEWQFKVTVGEVSNVMISRIAKLETIDGVPLLRLDAEVAGKTVANEHLRQTAEGIFRHRFNGNDANPPFRLLTFPVKPNDKWQGEYVMGREKGKYVCETKEETVEVPAGKFKALRVSVRLDTDGQIVNTDYWFVLNMGFVRQTVSAKGLEIVLELEKFTPAKQAKK